MGGLVIYGWIVFCEKPWNLFISSHEINIQPPLVSCKLDVDMLQHEMVSSNIFWESFSPIFKVPNP